MFDKVFIEKNYITDPFTLNILTQIKFNTQVEIDSIEDVWGKVKKPYLHKRTNLNLFIGAKKGTRVKEAPAAYGHGPEKHFYYIHAYNCIYECQYCYLQGYFKTPDIVLFVNHKEIIEDMIAIANNHPDAWFHAGEFSDSLSLSHITNEFEYYFDFFKNHPQNKLEIRTKSVNIKALLKLAPLPNVFVSFTLSSHENGKIFDEKCPSVKARIRVIKQLVEYGYNIGIHFDPIIYEENFQEHYQTIVNQLADVLPNSQLGYISIGVVRFTKDVYYEVSKNYPDTQITKHDYVTSFDGKVRYSRPMRNWMLNSIKEMLIKKSYNSDKIYFCMED